MLWYVARLPDSENHRDPLRQQSPCDKRHRLRGCPIQPLHVIDETNDRRRLGRLGQQAKDGECYCERIRGAVTLRPERRPERVALRYRQLGDPLEQRRAQLVQAGVRELHL